jgi:hypothetical protein
VRLEDANVYCRPTQNILTTCHHPLFPTQAVTTESGELLDSITAVQSISSKMFRELVVLGECCKDPKHFDSYEDLHSLLEDMASVLALTPDGLLKVDWFIQVRMLV